MKKMRKLLSLVMVFALVMSMTITGASASEEDACDGTLCDEHYTEVAAVEDCESVVAPVSDTEVSSEETVEADNSDTDEVEVNTIAEGTEQEISPDSADTEPSSDHDEVIDLTTEVIDTTGSDSDGLLVSGVAETEEPIEEVSFEEIAVTLDAAELTYISKPEIWDGQTDETCEVLVEYDVYYSKAFAVLDLINEERAKYDLSPVIMDESLMETALMRAAETAIYWGHVRPNNQSFRTANTEMIRPSGENIGRGCIYPEEMVAGWMSSTGHAANILDHEDVSMGIACIVVDGVILWVMDCSTVVYKEASIDSYTDGAGSIGVHTVCGLVEDDTSVDIEKKILQSMKL